MHGRERSLTILLPRVYRNGYFSRDERFVQDIEHMRANKQRVSDVQNDIVCTYIK